MALTGRAADDRVVKTKRSLYSVSRDRGVRGTKDIKRARYVHSDTHGGRFGLTAIQNVGERTIEETAWQDLAVDRPHNCAKASICGSSTAGLRGAGQAGALDSLVPPPPPGTEPAIARGRARLGRMTGGRERPRAATRDRDRAGRLSGVTAETNPSGGQPACRAVPGRDRAAQLREGGRRSVLGGPTHRRARGDLKELARGR